MQGLGLGAAAHAPLLCLEEGVGRTFALGSLPILVPANVVCAGTTGGSSCVICARQDSLTGCCVWITGLHDALRFCGVLLHPSTCSRDGGGSGVGEAAGRPAGVDGALHTRARRGWMVGEARRHQRQSQSGNCWDTAHFCLAHSNSTHQRLRVAWVFPAPPRPVSRWLPFQCRTGRGCRWGWAGGGLAHTRTFRSAPGGPGLHGQAGGGVGKAALTSRCSCVLATCRASQMWHRSAQCALAGLASRFQSPSTSLATAPAS